MTLVDAACGSLIYFSEEVVQCSKREDHDDDHEGTLEGGTAEDGAVTATVRWPRRKA